MKTKILSGVLFFPAELIQNYVFLSTKDYHQRDFQIKILSSAIWLFSYLIVFDHLAISLLHFS
jgi:hypothetical protein